MRLAWQGLLSGLGFVLPGMPGVVPAVEETDPKDKGKTLIKGRKTGPTMRWPKVYAAACIKFLDERFDEMFTVNNDQVENSLILWSFTGQRPMSSTAAYQAKYWEDMYAAFAKGQQRKKDLKILSCSFVCLPKLLP